MGAERAAGLLVRKTEVSLISYFSNDEVRLFSGVVQTPGLRAAKQITSWAWHTG